MFVAVRPRDLGIARYCSTAQWKLTNTKRERCWAGRNHSHVPERQEGDRIPKLCELPEKGPPTGVGLETVGGPLAFGEFLEPHEMAGHLVPAITTQGRLFCPRACILGGLPLKHTPDHITSWLRIPQPQGKL